MSITVEYENWMEWARKTKIGCSFLDEPKQVQDALNDIFDGGEYNQNSGSHPDDVYGYSYENFSDEELLTGPGWNWDFDIDERDPADIIEENEDDVRRVLEHDYTILAHMGGTWYLLK